MARFDWKAAVVNIACEVEGSLLAERMFPELRPEYTLERNKRSRYAAWLCRSYNRKGIPRKAVAA